MTFNPQMAEDVINAISVQRDQALNQIAVLQAEKAQWLRDQEALQKQITTLTEKLSRPRQVAA